MANTYYANQMRLKSWAADDRARPDPKPTAQPSDFAQSPVEPQEWDRVPWIDGCFEWVEKQLEKPLVAGGVIALLSCALVIQAVRGL
jgi:hypothetical protein